MNRRGVMAPAKLSQSLFGRRTIPRIRLNRFSSRSVTSSSSFEQVDLAFEKAEPPAPPSNNASPVVILHGLFGQKQNWRSLSRVMAKSMKTNVYAVDLRSHGTSPHHSQMNYRAMASDVRQFFDTHSLSNVSLIGHSMGGKVAATVALDPNLPTRCLSSLIMVDIAPLKAKLSSEFIRYAQAMQDVEVSSVPDSKSAHKVLDKYDIELPVQQFLLTNLGGKDDRGGRRFRIPVDTLKSALEEGNIGDFPYDVGEAIYQGRTLMIRGSNSSYVKDEQLDQIRQLFPNMDLETLQAGHWVHAERPAEFLEVVKQFLVDQ